MTDVHPLKAWRDRQDPPLTLDEAAKQFGVAKSTVSRWETGARDLEEDYLRSVSEKTGIPAAVLRPDLAELFQPAAQ